MGNIYNISQLDKKLSSTSKMVTPKEGWIKTIRTTLGMSRKQLANKLGITERRVAAIEESEKNDSLKLSTLVRVAEAFDCELTYALTPRLGSSLEKLIRAQALKKAKELLDVSAQHMSLEDQLAQDEFSKQLELLTDELLHKSLKGLWDNE